MAIVVFALIFSRNYFLKVYLPRNRSGRRGFCSFLKDFMFFLSFFIGMGILFLGFLCVPCACLSPMDQERDLDTLELAFAHC